jgi:serine/threonine protein kinase
MPICPKCRGENPELGAKCPRDGYYYIYDDAIEDAQKDEWIGRLAADKYVILSLISEGGMGAVYRAMQLPVQREIAFKVLRAELQDSDQGQDRFAREARAVSKLSHPNIITMHDFGVDSNGHPFMAMEYAPGKSLADWIMQPGLKLDRISHVFRQILSALSEAHNQGIVHRDLKPENLIVTRTGADEDYIKLLDFGIARMVHDGATRGLTKEGEVFGTPHYMAPEQAQGKKDIGPPADVYALGIMLYEMLVGQCPFDAPTPLSILYMHINDDLPDLDPRTGIAVPEGVREVINRATAKDPSERYQTASEMLAAFDQATGNNQGKYIAPAGTSSEQINVTQSMGVQGGGQKHVPKATADTLHFEDEPAQHLTDSSNAVPIQDPEQSNSTTAALTALKADSTRKALVVVLVLAILAAAGSAFVLLGGDSGGVEATEQATSEPAKEDDPSQPDQQDQQDQPDQQDQQDEKLAAEHQAPDDQMAVDQAPDNQAPDDGPQVAASDGQTAADESTVDSAKSSSPTENSKPASSGTGEPQKASGDTSPTSPDKTPAKTTADQAGDPSTDGSSSGDDTKDDQPEKFQPKKFEPKSNSDDDDEPEKFEPRKWR